jgi:hypothetical protein
VACVSTNTFTKAKHFFFPSLFFSGCPNHEIGQTFLFKGHILGTCSYFGADYATKKNTVLPQLLLWLWLWLTLLLWQTLHKKYLASA